MTPIQRPDYAGLMLELRPAGYWPLGDVSGDFKDLIAGNDLVASTLTSGTQRGVASPYGPALDMSGALVSYAKGSAEIFRNASAGTIAGWCKVNPATQDRQMVFGEGDNQTAPTSVRFGLGLDATGQNWAVQLTDGTTSPYIETFTEPTGDWQFIVGKFTNGGNLTILINDGSVSDSVGVSINASAGTTKTFKVGGEASNRQFLGQVTQVGVWTRELSADECLALYRVGRNKRF